MPITSLNLPTSPRSSVFRAIESVLRADPALTRVVKTWRSWEGATGDLCELSALPGSAALRLTPVNEPEDFQFPDALTGRLRVGIDLAVPGTRVDDVLDLWWAVERALYPVDQTARLAVQQALRGAGARTGLVTFVPPALSREEGTPNWHASGQLVIDVLLQLNT